MLLMNELPDGKHIVKVTHVDRSAESILVGIALDGKDYTYQATPGTPNYEYARQMSVAWEAGHRDFVLDAGAGYYMWGAAEKPLDDQLVPDGRHRVTVTVVGVFPRKTYVVFEFEGSPVHLVLDKGTHNYDHASTMSAAWHRGEREFILEVKDDEYTWAPAHNDVQINVQFGSSFDDTKALAARTVKRLEGVACAYSAALAATKAPAALFARDYSTAKLDFRFTAPLEVEPSRPDAQTADLMQLLDEASGCRWGYVEGMMHSGRVRVMPDEPGWRLLFGYGGWSIESQDNLLSAIRALFAFIREVEDE